MYYFRANIEYVKTKHFIPTSIKNNLIIRLESYSREFQFEKFPG